jgi:uncharacterized protein (DUF2252 family)
MVRGRSHRDTVSRSALGDLHASARKIDVIATLRQFQAERVPALLPEKYRRMSVSPFAFFRGSVGLMIADLARLPHTGIITQLCGDAHLQNLGSFEAPDGRIIFDINDFDETIAGPWEWDVKRMAVSFVLAGREANHGRSGCSLAVETLLATYREAIARLAAFPILDAARLRTHLEAGAPPVSAALRQSRRARPLDLVQKYTVRVNHTDRAKRHGTKDKRTRSGREPVRRKQAPREGGQTIFVDLPPVLRRASDSERRAVLAALPLYRRTLSPERQHFFDFFQPCDVGFKIVGTGSVGLRDWVVLMFGNGELDPLFLQVKQEVCSAYSGALGSPLDDHQGQRVVDGQRRIQAFSDLLLGWTTVGRHQYLVRQLNDHKGSIDLASLRGDGLRSLAEVAGELLAHGHARAGDAREILGYLGNGEKVSDSITRFAHEYAALVDADFKVFRVALKKGQLPRR